MSTNPIIRKLVDWSEQQPSVRVAILTSTRTNPNIKVDLFSDYDVILVVTEVHPFYEDRSWLDDFGSMLVVYRDPLKTIYNQKTFAYITQYEDGLKIDFTLWPVEVLQRVVAEPKLPPYLDVGYTVLVDKDGLTVGLKPPTYQAYIPTPPNAATYQNVIEEFFHEATYVAKHLWRDDLLAAKYNLDKTMKLDNLRQMLEWHMEISHNWSVKTGAYGKGLKARLKPEIWAELESTYTGAGLDENWEALFKTILLFRKVAIEVGDHLRYDYLHDLDHRVSVYLRKVMNLDRQAESFE